MDSRGVAPSWGTTVDVFGVRLTVTDYERATERIMNAARAKTSFGVSALAVHGLMEAVNDERFRRALESIDMLTPDGQPVRWAMNVLGKAGLKDRVYGPDLAWHVLRAAADEQIGVFLFGSTEEICESFAAAIRAKHPSLAVHYQSDRFRDATAAEDLDDIDSIHESGAGVVLVGRGCPLQERWVADHKGTINAAMLAVGAAFDYGAGTLRPPPKWMQKVGLQWAFRLAQDPRRLWRRYLTTNTAFVFHFVKAVIRKVVSRSSNVTS